MTLKLYSPDNNSIVAFDKTRAGGSFPAPFKCSAGKWWPAEDLHAAEVIEVYVAGVKYEDAPEGSAKKRRGVFEIRGEDIGKITPDFYTVYTVSNTDTPTQALTDHKKVEKAILAGAEIARQYGLPLNLRLAQNDGQQ